MKYPKWIKTVIAILFLLTFIFIACSGAAEAKGSSSHSSSHSTTHTSSKPSTSKPTTSKPSTSSSSTSKPQTSTKPITKPSTTINYTAKSTKNSSYATISNLSSGGKNKFDFSRPYKSMKNYNYSNLGSSVHYYGNTFMSNYIDYMIIQELMDTENDDDKNNDNDAWLLMYMILR